MAEATMFSFLKSRRRRQLLAVPFTETQLAHLRQNVFLYRTLTDEAQSRLRDAARILIAEKYWEGCGGLDVTEEMQVTVAGQAGLMLLGLDDYYFDELSTILLYPGSFLRSDPTGMTDEVENLIGEAHHGGPVVLSWWDALWSGRRLADSNVVLHELAHKLAELGDLQEGMPRIDDPELARRWKKVIPRECERLARDSDYGRPTLLDPYGASSPAEFFPVATEAFFMRPRPLRRLHAELYDLLAAWYRQDPASRRIPDAAERDAARAFDEDYARHAIDECTTALRLRPDYLDAYRRRADLYGSLGRHEQAVADWNAVIQQTSGEPQAEAYFERGLAHRDLERDDEALADFDAALRLCPDFGRAYCERGATHAMRGNLDQALADLSKAVRLDRRDEIAYLERGRIYVERGEHEKGLRDLDRSLQIHPTREAYEARAEAHEALGNGEQARQDQAAAESWDAESDELA